MLKRTKQPTKFRNVKRILNKYTQHKEYIPNTSSGSSCDRNSFEPDIEPLGVASGTSMLTVDPLGPVGWKKVGASVDHCISQMLRCTGIRGDWRLGKILSK